MVINEIDYSHSKCKIAVAVTTYFLSIFSVIKVECVEVPQKGNCVLNSVIFPRIRQPLIL